MTDEPAGIPEINNRGAVIKLFGVLLIILGGLNSMLSWRGGFDVIPFYVILIITGIIFCIIGSVRHQKHS
jgi:hypothetical protein